jgi:histidinol-phosphatase (PHP family)
VNLHTHTTYCDGTASSSDFVKKAKQLQWDYLGFSAHAPLPFLCDWAIKATDLDKYIAEIRDLANLNQPNIKILCGFEIDYLLGLGFPALEYKAVEKSDFLISSIHFVKNPNTENPNNQYLEIDGTYSQFLLALKSFGFNLKKLLQAFLDATHQMIMDTTVGVTKIIGHVDKIILNAAKTSEFGAIENWFYDELFQIVQTGSNSYDFVEINTRAMYKKGLSNPYPKLDFISRLHYASVPLIINSDAHHPSELNGSYSTLYQLLSDCGMESIVKKHPKF